MGIFKQNRAEFNCFGSFLLLLCIDFRPSSATPEKLGQMRQLYHTSLLRGEKYIKLTVPARTETDMGWLLELLEDIYSNEVKHRMKRLAEDGDTSETPHLCNLHPRRVRKLTYLFFFKVIFLSVIFSFVVRRSCNLQGVVCNPTPLWTPGLWNI